MIDILSNNNDDPMLGWMIQVELKRGHPWSQATNSYHI